MAQHAAPRTTSRRRVLVVVGIVLASLLLAGVALAAFLLRAPITGGGTTGKATLAWSGSASVQQGPCTVAQEDGAVRIQFADVFPGDQCVITGKVTYALSRPARVQAPVFVQAPGVSLTFGSGSHLHTGDVIQGDATPMVQLVLTFGPELESGRTLTADTSAGITAVDVAA